MCDCMEKVLEELVRRGVLDKKEIMKRSKLPL